MQLRILTFNIFFDAVGREPRMRAIGRLVERARPAVVGFQEVTRETLALLKAQPWAKYYDCSTDTARPFSEAYFVVLFSALPVLALETLPFANTGMGRELVFMTLAPAPGCSLIVGTSHLESLPQFARPRVEQLRESLTLLRDRVVALNDSDTKCLGAVFMGDTNLLRGDMALLDRRLAGVANLDVEAAKTGRSKCRECGEAIAKGAVRVGKLAKERVPSGKTVETRHWFHESCFTANALDTEKEFVQDKSRILTAEDEKTADAAPSKPSIDMATVGLPGGWTDLWLSVEGNTEENGVTFDGKRNALVTSRAFQSRLDRMYFYPGTAELRDKFNSASSTVLENIQIVGKQPIADGLWPSDHYGLLAAFNFGIDDSKPDSTSGRSADQPDESSSRSKTAPIAIN